MCRLLYIQLEVEAWVCINPHIKCVRFMTVLIIHSEPDPVCWSCSDGDTADWKEPGEERARGSGAHCHAPVHCEGLLRLCLYLVSPSLYVCVYISDIQLIAKRRLVGVQCLSQSHVVKACGLIKPVDFLSWDWGHLATFSLPAFWLQIRPHCLGSARWGETSRSYIRRPHWHDKFIIISISSELFTATTSSRCCSELASFIRC